MFSVRGPLRDIADKCLDAVRADMRSRKVVPPYNSHIRPDVVDIFAAFKYCDLRDLNCIIIGQDPFPGDEAHGLCFSSRGDVVPGSTRNIFACLRASLGIERTNPNLTDWARQGILLLNTYLTRAVRAPHEHSFWLEFTQRALQWITCDFARELSPRTVYVLLWGKKAASLEPYISAGTSDVKFKVLRWNHPSPLSTCNNPGMPERFELCDHFVRVSDSYPMLLWARIAAVYVDGGCRGNNIKNNPRAIGAAGVYMAPTWRGNRTCVTASRGIYLSSADGRVTNQRAELIAVVEAFRILARERAALDRIYLITDSQQYVMSWMNGRLWKKLPRDLPNSDLVQQLREVVLQFAQLYKPCAQIEDSLFLLDGVLSVLHVNSHIRSTAGMSDDDIELVRGNAHADTLCNQCMDAKYNL